MEEWFSSLENSDTQLLLSEMRKKYQLTKEEYLNLLDMSIYNNIFTGKELSLECITFMCNELLKNRELIQKNQNQRFVNACLSKFAEEAEQIDPTFSRVQRFLDSNFVFHTFNGAFLEKIKSQGLIMKEKPWDLGKIDEIETIMKKASHPQIFGVYQGKRETPIHFADNLFGSPYYGVSSPTFFRKFIEHNPKYFNVFVNRDYPRAKESADELCENLSEEEAKIVQDFFQEYWQEFATDRLPCVAVSTKQKLGIKMIPSEKSPEETLREYYVRRSLGACNFVIRKNIPLEDIEIFDMETLSLVPKQKEKNI